MEHEVEMRAYFFGKVQGVFFRATIKEYADYLNIKGCVRNLSNGSVELIAIGLKNRLEKLINLSFEFI